MKIFLTTVLLVMVIMLGFTGISEAQDCRELIGTWNINATVTSTEIEGSIDIGETDKTIFNFSNVEDDVAVGYEFHDECPDGDRINGIWNPTLGQYVISWPYITVTWDHNGEELPYVSIFCYCNIDGDHMYGELDCIYFKCHIEGLRVLGTEWVPLCTTDQPYFNIDTHILSLPTVCINGETYEDIAVILNSDGTWGIAE